MSVEQKDLMQRKRVDAIRRSAKEGSKLEKFFQEKFLKLDLASEFMRL